MERRKRINKKTEVFIYLETSFSYVALACLELTAVWDDRSIFETIWNTEKKKGPAGCLWAALAPEQQTKL